jgi:alanine racemase
MPLSPPEIHQPTIAAGEVLRPTYLEIDLGRIAENYHRICAHSGVAVMPILKANAYGHGLVAVAQRLVAEGAKQLGLAYLEEAIRLRESGIDVSILVLGGILGRQIPEYIRHDLVMTASSVDKLRAIDQAAAAEGRRARVHLKVDTGMERIGVHWYSADSLLTASLSCSHVTVEGVFSHFAGSDARDRTGAELQLERFLEVTSFWDRNGLPTPTRHMANSGAILQLPAARLDMVRPGILLFGVYPSADVARSIVVQPAMTWKSRVVYFKVVKPGNPVGYGGAWTPDRLTRVVTIPVGYGDGYLRSMAGSAQVIIRGQRYPVVGSVCMDQVMVDIGWDSAWNGDEVVLLGEVPGQAIGADELARWAGTIPYEILTNINTRVPRLYVG